MGQAGKRPSDVFRARVAEVRRRKGWSQQDLANRLAELGAPIDRATVTRTEAGDRGVSLDDAILYAAALGVSPVHLFVPLRDEPTDLAPNLTVSPRAARQWVRGLGPLREEDRRIYYTEVSDEEWARMTETSLHLILARVQDVVDAATDGDRDREADLIDDLNDLLEREKRSLREKGT